MAAKRSVKLADRLNLFRRWDLRSFDQPFDNFDRLLLFISFFRCRALSAQGQSQTNKFQFNRVTALRTLSER